MSKLHHYSVSRHVSAAPATVWDVISDHTGMPQWTPFRTARLEVPGRPHRNGAGAVRAMHLVGPPTREEVIEFDPPHRLRYRLLSGLPFRDYEGEVTVEPEGTGTRLSTDLCFRTRITGTQFFGPIAIRLATRGAARVAERRAKTRVLARGHAPVMTAINQIQPPTRWQRAAFRLPIYLYRLNLGWLFGRRLLLLHHIGRISGKPRQTILEVIEHNVSDDTYVVASGWGPTAQWYQNIRAHPEINIRVATKTIPMRAVLLSREDGAEIFVRYASHHRTAAKYIWPPVLGQSVDGSDADFLAFGRQLAFVRLIPRARQ